MMHEKILDKILRTLADLYESGAPNGCRTFEVTTPEEYEPFQETMAALRSEGSVSEYMKGYRLTDAGYRKYSDRINALRVLP
jgi:hypothetical protein